MVKGKEKGQLEARYDDETSNGEPDDESGDGLMMNPSTHPYKDMYDVSAQFIVQQVSRHFILPKTNRVDILLRHERRLHM